MVKFYRVGLLVVGVGLLAVSFGLGIAGNQARHNQDRDRRLVEQATIESQLLSEYFDRARTVTLLSAQNPAFAAFYAAPGSRDDRIAAGGPAVTQVQTALAYIETLYPNRAVSEVCFIHNSGAENARVVADHVAEPGELSPNETANPFFAPTLALGPGQVYQAAPYVSPDTNQWVISNSTALADTGRPAVLHFEVALDSFRAALSSGGKDEAVVVNAATGDVVLDAHHPLVAGGPLGDPDDRSYPQLAHLTQDSGLVSVDGERLAFQRIAPTPGNVNDWLVVAKVPMSDATLLSSVGWGPGLVLLAGMCVLGFTLSSFRAGQRRLQLAARTDRLTGLPNRAALNERIIAHGHRTSERDGTVAAVLMVDLDRFKEVNDTLGHHKGDLVLIEVGQRLRHAVRDTDLVVRLGGDEFAVYLDHLAKSDDAVSTAERIVAAMRQPVMIDGLPLHVGASVGVATYPDHATDAHLLMQYADVAMYEAKRSRSGYRLYNPNRDDHSERRLRLAAQLNTAINDRQLVVHYQPKVDLVTRTASGIEALVRWNHPTLGLIPPTSSSPSPKTPASSPRSPTTC